MDAAQKSAQKAKLGQKWTCFSCSVRFYDLNKPDPICPKCQADQRLSPAFEKTKTKRARKKTPKKKIAAPKPPPPDEEQEETEAFDEIELDDVEGEVVEVEPDED